MTSPNPHIPNALIDPTSTLLGDPTPEDLRVQRTAFTAIRREERLGLDELAARCGLPSGVVADVLGRLATAGMIRRDADGVVLGIAGLTLEPSTHRLQLDGADLFTWCAFDVVGIPAALRTDAIAGTTCPTCSAPIEVAFRHGKATGPPDAVGFLPDPSCSNVLAEFCPSANLFCSPEHLDRWRQEAGNPSGEAMDLAAFTDLGAACWAHLAQVDGG